MVDVAIKDQLKTYWNWALAWTPNAIYDEIVNFDVVKNPYKIRKDQNSFFLRKRKWFKQSFAWISWTCVDIQDLYDMDCNWWEWRRYYYYVNWTTHTIYKRQIWTCDAPTSVDSWTACDCQFQWFIKTDFVKWPKRKIFTTGTPTTDTTTWIIVNTDATWNYLNWGIYDTWDTWNYEWATSWIQMGDFVWFYHNWGSSNSIPWQVKRITWYDASWYWWASTLRMSSPWSMVWTTFPNTDSDVWAAIFPERWDVLLYVGKDTWYMWASNAPAVKIIHSPHSIDPSTWVQNDTDTITIIWPTIGEWGRCVASMTEHWDDVLIHYSNWYTAFGWGWYSKFYHSLESQFFFGKEIKSITSYRNFVLWFWDKRIVSAVKEWEDYTRDILRDNLWIISPKAYWLFDNSFYFVASDKRLYAIDIKRDWSNYILELSDQSWPMLGHLNNIKTWDVINIYLDREELKIFHIISWNTYPEIKTKILTFNKDYSLFHWWETWFSIYWINDTEYFWSAVWFNCWDQDWSDYFEAKINAYIWDNTQNSTEASVFQKVWVERGKILLWNWIYNNWFTYVNVYSWREGWKTIQKLWKIEDIAWTQRYWEYVVDWTVTFDTWAECISWLWSWEEVLYSWPAWGSEYETIDDSRCWPSAWYSCPDYIEENVEWIKILSELDKLSEIWIIHVPIKTYPSDLIKVEIVSKWLDILNFWWMLWEVQKYPFEDKNTIWDFVLADNACNLSYQ